MTNSFGYINNFKDKRINVKVKHISKGGDSLNENTNFVNTKKCCVCNKRCVCCWCFFTLLILGLVSGGYFIYYDMMCSLSDMTIKEYGGYTFHIADGDEISNIMKVNTDLLNQCITKNNQPIIILHDKENQDQYGGSTICGAPRIYMNNNARHTSLFVHEYIHYLDDIKWQYSLPCVSELFNKIQYNNSLWGDNGGFPYCYDTIVLPNKYEYVATLFEGYCTNECGPTKEYLSTTNNTIAAEQLQCVNTFLQ